MGAFEDIDGRGFMIENGQYPLYLWTWIQVVLLLAVTAKITNSVFFQSQSSLELEKRYE